VAEPLLDRWLRRQGWMERWGDAIQGAVGAIYSSLGRPGRALKDAMHGTTVLGHPLHPAITDVPLGAWTVAVIADYVAHFSSRIPTEAGDIALAIGLVTALLAAATGYTDFHETFAHERRAALLHGLTNTVVVVLMAVSLALRWWAGAGAHPVAVAIATVGWVLVIFGAYVGGHLVFGLGTMVNRDAFLEGFEGAVAVGASTEFPEGELRRVNASGMPVLMVRRAGQLFATSAVCSHAGGPLDEGTLDGTVVTCPWHGSRFDVRDGRVCGGPATFPLPALRVVEAAGQVTVELAQPLH
jgi:nitrite reductase/ring-hydroxylating ferredoxin subunit